MHKFLLVMVALLALLSPACAPVAPPPDIGSLVKVQTSLQSFLDKLDGDLRSAALELGGTGIDTPAARLVLQRVIERQPRVIDVVTVSPGGKIVLAEPARFKHAEGTDLSAQPQVRQLLKTQQPVMSGRMMMVEGMAAVDVEQPVFSASREFRGSVSAIFDPGALVAGALDAVPGTAGQRYYAIQPEGVVLYSRDGEEIGRNVFSDALFKTTPEKQVTLRQVAAGSAGSTAPYASADAGRGARVLQSDHWVTVSLHGTAWRLGVSVPVSPATITNLSFLTEDYRPFNYLEGGQLKGMSVDLLEMSLNRLGAGFGRERFQVLPWTAAYQKALKDRNTVLFAAVRTPERQPLFKWAGPIAPDRTVAFTTAGRELGLKSLSDLKAYRVGVVKDDRGETLLKMAGFHESELVVRGSALEVYRALRDGILDVWVYGEGAADGVVRGAGDAPSRFAVAMVLKEEEAWYAFSLDVPDEVVAAFQQSIEGLRLERSLDGVSQYEKVMARYVQPRYTRDPVTREKAVQLGTLTAADIARDAPGTFQKINQGLPPYRDTLQPSLYTFVFDQNVRLMANADNPTLAGRYLRGTTDVAGKLFRDELVAGALQTGSGWVDYVYTKPGEGGLFFKESYYLRVTGSDGFTYVVGAGRYKDAP